MNTVATGIEVSLDTHINSYNHKEMKPYVALIKGPGDRFALDRSFLKGRIIDEEVRLPDRDGVYEVRDYPGGNSRTRYFQVMDAAVLALETLNDEDVLDAVSKSDAGEWGPVVSRGQQRDGTPEDVLMVLEACEQNLLEMISDGIDEEDVRMEMDRIRQAIERMRA